METKLAENIKRFRKERLLTQEQLADVLGVTVGAVYKWESKLSVPELGLIVEMADFFDTSVDVLLGYEMKDNRLESCMERLKEYRRAKDPEGISEAEKALKKYPHIFEIVHQAANMYRLHGFEYHDKKSLRRSLKLFEESLLLLAQNDNPETVEISIYGEIASVYLALEEYEKGIDILKKHNVSGLYNDTIGQFLSYNEDSAEEAPYYLSMALVSSISSIIRIISGYLNVYEKRKDNESTLALLKWSTNLLSMFSEKDTVAFTDKINATFMSALADAQLKSGDITEARKTLEKARSLALRFDTAPDYSASAIRFTEQLDNTVASDDLGISAAEGLENSIRELDSKELSELWEEL